MANPKMTKQWFIYAARDLKAARIMIPHGVQFKNLIVFHVQQCIEKSLKGFLVFQDVRPPKTHKIEDLVRLALPFNTALAALFRGAERIYDRLLKEVMSLDDE